MKAFDPRSTRGLSARMIFTIPLCWYCAYIAWDRWIIQNTDPSEFWRGYVCAVFLCIVHPLLMFALSYIGGIWARIFMKYEVSSAGISTGGFLLGKNEYLWDDIKTYAVNAKNKDNIFIMFSKKETDNSKTGNLFAAINKNQLVLQLYNDDIWYEMSYCMPDDVHSNISAAFESGDIMVFNR